MRRLAARLTSSLVALAVLASPLVARAQDDDASPPPGTVAPVPHSARAPNGEYVAPLQQQTQIVYVPQSVAMSGPRVITDWEDGEPIPQGYHQTTRTRTGMIVAGAVTFGSLYFLSLLVASVGSDTSNGSGSSNPVASLYVPGVGPFIQMTNSSSATANLFLAIDGIAQVGGIAMLVYGITSPRTVLIRNDLAQTIVTPMRIGQSGYGLGVLTRF
jgi:hypothetical protein